MIIPVAIFKVDMEEFAGRSITHEEFQKFKDYLRGNNEYDVAEKSFYLLRDKIWPAFVEENPEFKNEEVAQTLSKINKAENNQITFSSN